MHLEVGLCNCASTELNAGSGLLNHAVKLACLSTIKVFVGRLKAVLDAKDKDFEATYLIAKPVS